MARTTPPTPPAPQPELRLEGPAAALMRALDALRQVSDPYLKTNIVDLGLVELLRVSEGNVELRLVSTVANCPLSDFLATEAMRALQLALPDTDIYITHDQDVEWSPRRASAAARLRLDMGGWA